MAELRDRCASKTGFSETGEIRGEKYGLLETTGVNDEELSDRLESSAVSTMIFFFHLGVLNLPNFQAWIFKG